MSNVSINKSTQQNENTSENTEIDKKNSNASEAKSLTFKDWKKVKDCETNSMTLNKQTKSKYPNKTCYRDHRNNNADFKANRQATAASFLSRYSIMHKTFNDINNSGMHAYNNSLHNFGFNGCDRQNNNYLKNRCNVVNNFNGPSTNHSFSDSFFASDDIYPQRDMIQKPLLNPFEKDLKSKHLLYKLETRQNNSGKKKNNSDNKQNNTKIMVSPSPAKTESTTNMSLSQEPKVYVPNPNASKDGKAFIPKPKLPQENLQISKEEKKKQWKEYREAMKPFKNREFYNAKRVVQRLGKKNVSELDERELFRLTNAREVMAAHKARLTAKYSDYVKAEDKSNELGEVYVLKKPPVIDWEVRKTKTKGIQNYGSFSEINRNSIIEPGRKILGGYSHFKGFVPGGMLDGTTQLMGQISAL